jgi:transcription elongation factor GreB
MDTVTAPPCHAPPVSKAFTKDDSSDAPVVVAARPPLPAGVTNYVTPRGLALLKDELGRLRLDRGRLEAKASDPEGPRELAVAVARVAEIEARLACAQVVDASEASAPRDQVRFGATVTVRSERGGERTYEVVGVDEADIATGRIAFVAPLARALLGKSVGDVVTLRTPRGEEELEVVSIV